MTYPLSSSVSAGDATLAAHYNNLRSDALNLGQAAANAVTLATLLERYESRLSVERLNTDQIRVPASTTAPVSLMIAGYMVQAVANVDLAVDAKPSGAASNYYIFANRADASTTFTITVSTSITEGANQRLIGRFYWDGTKIIKDSVRSEQAVFIKSLLYYVEPQVCEGRLTASTGVPVTTSDVASTATVYFTPFTGSRVALYAENYGWRLYAFSELSLSVAALSTDKNFDVWLYDNAGTLTLDTTEWSNDTLRATAIVRQDGVWVKTGAPAYRYLGTIRTSGAGVTCDTTLKRFIWNFYNQRERSLYVHDSTANWTYNTRTIRAWNNSSSNRVEFVIGINEVYVDLVFVSTSSVASSTDHCIGIGLDSTSVMAVDSTHPTANNTTQICMTARYSGYPGLGLHYLQLLEVGGNGVNATFYGTYNAGQNAVKSAGAGHING